jgi:hypothetical protein
MIIRYADHSEVDIQASRAELDAIQAALVLFAESDETTLSFAAEPEVDPGEFDRTLVGLDFVKGSGQVVLSVPSDRAVLSGDPAHFDALSGYFTFDETDTYPEHHHLEYRPGHEILDETAIPLVIWIQEE